MGVDMLWCQRLSAVLSIVLICHNPTSMASRSGSAWLSLIIRGADNEQIDLDCALC